jgi:NDP-sugar pyrophosphorylase family protein
MTDLLQAMIDKGIPVGAVTVQRGWLEFDTVEDYEKMRRMHEDASLDMLCIVRRV